MTTQWHQRLAAVSLAASLFVTGCSQNQGPQIETGALTVTVKDGEQALSGVTVRLVSLNGQAGAIADVDGNGNAQFSELEVGEYRVAIFPVAEGDPNPEATANSEKAAKPVKIPAKFQDEAQTPWRAVVAKGTSDASFDLRKK